MTRDEMLERISSKELTEWAALFSVESDERQAARDRAESGDGQVFDPMREGDDGDDGDAE